MIAEVIVNYKSKSVDRVFDYAVSEELEDKIRIGSCVIVSFGAGNRHREAYVVGIKDRSSAKRLKPVLRLAKDIRLFDEKQLELIKWMREKYLVTYLDAISVIAPSGSSVNQEEWIELIAESDDEIAKLLKENGGAMEINRLMGFFEENVSRRITSLEKKSIVKRIFRDSRNVKDKVVTVAKITVQPEEIPEIMRRLEKSNAFVQAKMLEILSSCEYLSLADLVNFSEGSYSALRGLEKKGYIETFEITVMRTIEEEHIIKPRPRFLTSEQRAVLEPLYDTIEKGEYSPYLLHGVTGSGKTEVYLRVIEEVLKKGRQAIVLVPEISLTPQMTARFCDRFGGEVAIIHSGLSLGEKYDQWKKIREGRAKIAVGARSAVFAPFDNIGAIIMDEEHEQTYKSEMTPRYDTHQVAEFRARQYGALMIFASATPLVTTYYRAEAGELTLLEMKSRVNNNPMPDVYTVDLRSELENGNRSIISGKLYEEIEKNLADRKQTILFLNRRGFSTFVSCRSCGFVAECPNCSISLTYHKFDDSLRCHYCGHTIKNYKSCPSCGSGHIRYFGGGTQKVEEEIHRLFPGASTIRMDVDTTGRKHSHQQILNKFEQEKIDILIGTQMVTKGLDFPDVTLVGVISADTILNIDDYRSGERTFSTLEQVTGRAGRADSPGRSVIQTYSPEDKSIVLMQKHDYKSFYREEIAIRRAMWYPPFCEMVSVIFTGGNERLVKKASAIFAKSFSAGEYPQKVQLLGPIPAYISRIKNKYIYRLIIKCENSDALGEALAASQEACTGSGLCEGVTVVIDKNPNNMG